MSYIGKGVEVVTFNTATTLDVAGNITVGGTVDGRDVATDGTKLDTIAANAIANLSEDTTPQLGGNLDLNTSNVIGTGNINVTGSITGTSFVSTGDMSFTNNSKAIFGTSPSLEIYHDGSNSILDDVGAGNFKMQLAGADKLEITSTGVDVTGTVKADELYIQSTSNDSTVNTIQLAPSTTTNVQGGLGVKSGGIIDVNGVNSVGLQVSGTRFVNVVSGGDISFYDSTGVTQGFFWDASTQRLGLGTTSPSDTLEVSNASNYQLRLTSSGQNYQIGRNGSDGLLHFYGNQSGYTGYVFSGVNGERLRIDSSGFVGISTASPNAHLQVNGSLGNNTAILTDRNGTAAVTVDQYGTTTFANQVIASNLATNSSGTAMTFSQGASERMRIDSSGNVGIGTSSPTSKLSVVSGTNAGITVNDGTVNTILFNTSSANGSVGTTTNHPMAFYSNNTERMRIDSSGNVGIGTNSPTDPLTVIGSATIGNTTVAPITTELHVHKDFAGGSTPFGSESSVVISTNTTGAGVQGYIGSLWFGSQDVTATDQYGWNLAGMAGYMAGDTGTNGGSANLLFYTASASQTGTERMRITAGGNVGIGTASPAEKLTVSGNIRMSLGQLEFNDASVNIAIPAANTMSFDTSGVERMRIDSAGRLLVNANVNNAAGTSARFQVSYTKNNEFGIHIRPSDNNTGGGQPMLFQNQAGTSIGSISATATNVAFNTSSDYRLKTAVTYDWDATTRLKQLRPARFEWIADGDDAVPVDGFLAHEVQSVVPEAISGTHNEVDDEGNPVYQGIDQSKLVPLLVKTIQELEARITALETA